MTFREAYNEWKPMKQRFVKKSTMAAYIVISQNHLLPFFGDLPAEKIDKKTVQKFVDMKLDAGLSKKTVKDFLIVLKMIVRFVEEEYGIPVVDRWNIVFPTKNLDDEKKLERYTQEDFRKITETAFAYPSPTNLAILITITSGMRIGEICALQFCDIDLERKVFRISRTIERIYLIDEETGRRWTELIVNPPKTSSSRREIPIMRDIYPMVKKFASIARPEYYVTTMTEHPAEPRTFRGRYRDFILNKVGLKECIKYHGLRHTFASILIENKVDVKTVSTILGHSDIGTTMNVYVHPTENMKRNAINGALKKSFKGI